MASSPSSTCSWPRWWRPSSSRLGVAFGGLGRLDLSGVIDTIVTVGDSAVVLLSQGAEGTSFPPRHIGLEQCPRPHTPSRDDRGVVAIEFVLILPFLLMLLMGILVLGNFLSVKGQASNFARDGARQAALFPGSGFRAFRTT